MFYGGYIFEFVGAVLRWVFGSIIRIVFNRKRFRFREYLYGPEDSDEWFDTVGHEFVNRLIGAGSIVLIC